VVREGKTRCADGKELVRGLLKKPKKIRGVWEGLSLRKDGKAQVLPAAVVHVNTHNQRGPTSSSKACKLYEVHQKSNSQSGKATRNPFVDGFRKGAKGLRSSICQPRITPILLNGGGEKRYNLLRISWRDALKKRNDC